MQTDVIFACYVEQDDFIHHLEHGILKVDMEPTDSGDVILFRCHDEEGLAVNLRVPPFSHLSVIVNFDDEPYPEIEDVDA